MAYHDVNEEGLTFSEWVQAAGLYKPMQGSAYGSADCAGYSTSILSRSSSPHFPLRIRKAWRNGEDPSDYLPKAPRRWHNPLAPAIAG